MTLAQLRSLVRNLAFERSGDTGLVDDAELDEIINLAQRNLYIHISNLWPAVFAEDSIEKTYNGSTTSGDTAFSALIASGQAVMKVIGVRVGSTGGGTPHLNKNPIPALDRPSDAMTFHQQGLIYPIYPARWWIESEVLKFTNAIGTSINFFATIIRRPADMTLTTDTPWGNKLPEHHDKIALLASQIVHMKDEKGDTPWTNLFTAFDDILSDSLGKATLREGQKA